MNVGLKAFGYAWAFHVLRTSPFDYEKSIVSRLDQ